ncbi:MAG: hypothetical protein JWN21_2608 [Sphingomonas bacterium]|uniref:DUF4136 domain-containing protein n=1 Tax=Sphingomonas bacterium TaxID=1895847 RepID=UPI00260D0FD9|nr:DUF4136 domain-containing protein [Sphingomonas bacterium]MDB5697065.1 hypothetical protein [Sphingomonas bacterium]
MRRSLALLATSALGLAACATTGGLSAPTDVIRYHLGAPVERGTVVVQPAAGGDGLSGQPFAAAVSRQLGLAGYVPAAPGGQVQFIALVDVRRSAQEGPRRPSPFSIGIGAGGYSGGGNGGVGLGGGIGIPIGKSRRNQLLGTELTVTIKRRVDQSPVWEGNARTLQRSPADEAVIADKLAAALFTGFPGESGRTITVR